MKDSVPLASLTIATSPWFQPTARAALRLARDVKTTVSAACVAVTEISPPTEICTPFPAEILWVSRVCTCPKVSNVAPERYVKLLSVTLDIDEVSLCAMVRAFPSSS